VPVLSGIELIFVIVANMGLCFGAEIYIDNTGMFSLLLSSAYRESKPCPLLTPLTSE